MADATQSPSPTKPTSLAFALGSLDATIKGQGEELARHRQTIEDLPDKLAIHFAPRFEAVEHGVKDLNSRVIVLEGDKRFVRGAFWVVAAAIVLVGGKAFMFR